MESTRQWTSVRNYPDLSLSEYLQGQTNDEAQMSAFIATNQAVFSWIRQRTPCASRAPVTK
jgi:hypothetical protein